MSINKKIFVSAIIAAFTLVVLPANAAYVHTMTLKVGSNNSQVMMLQQTLNANGFLVSATGAGSPGMETTTFGPKTKAAVMAFQSAKGLSPVDGIVGPVTGTALAALTGTTGGNTGGVVVCPAGYVCQPTGGNTNSGGTLSGGETTISSLNVNSADDTSLEEGASKAEVAQIKFKVKDADAQLDRADIVFNGSTNTSGGEDQPWRVFDKVYLLDDNGSTLASMSSDSKSAWDETSSSGIYRIRLTGINKVFSEGNTYTLHVAVDVSDSVDQAGSDADWTVYLQNDGLRFIDGAGVNTYEGDASDTTSFSIDAAGQSSKFTVTEDSSSPDAGNINVDTSNTTTETVAVFKLKADQDGGDIKVDDFPVSIELQGAGSGKTFADVISDVYLKIDGNTYTGDPASALTATANSTSSVVFNFSDIEDDNVVVNAGSTMTATVQVKFRAQGQSAANYANGTIVTASTDFASGDFEDADTGDNIGSISPTSGTVTAEDMGLYSSGIQVALVSTNTSVTTGTSNNDDIGTFTIKFKVTAFGDTVYIPNTASGSNSASSVDFTVDGTNATSVSGVIVDNTDTATTSNNNFAVDEGSSETFTVTVSAKDATSGLYRAALSNIRWNTNDSNTYSSYTSNLSDFKTDYISLN